MPRPGIAVPRGQASYEPEPAAVRGPPREDEPDRAAGVPGRHTVTITGRGAEGYASRNGTAPSMAARHRQVKRYERAGFRPDRVAMWAVLLGVTLMIAAAASSHAAIVAKRPVTLLAGHHTTVLAAHGAAMPAGHRAEMPAGYHPAALATRR